MAPMSPCPSPHVRNILSLPVYPPRPSFNFVLLHSFFLSRSFSCTLLLFSTVHVCCPPATGRTGDLVPPKIDVSCGVSAMIGPSTAARRDRWTNFALLASSAALLTPHSRSRSHSLSVCLALSLSLNLSHSRSLSRSLLKFLLLCLFLPFPQLSLYICACYCCAIAAMHIPGVPSFAIGAVFCNHASARACMHAPPPVLSWPVLCSSASRHQPVVRMAGACALAVDVSHIS